MSPLDLTSLPLHDRVFRVRSVAPAHPHTTNTHTQKNNRPANYKCWNKKHMTHAVTAVSEKQMSIRTAALHFNVPKSTLGDRMSGRVLMGAVSGPTKYLSNQERDELARFFNQVFCYWLSKNVHRNYLLCSWLTRGWMCKLQVGGGNLFVNVILTSH